jgi:hypothetical protein
MKLCLKIALINFIKNVNITKINSWSRETLLSFALKKWDETENFLK